MLQFTWAFSVRVSMRLTGVSRETFCSRHGIFLVRGGRLLLSRECWALRSGPCQLEALRRLELPSGPYFGEGSWGEKLDGWPTRGVPRKLQHDTGDRTDTVECGDWFGGPAFSIKPATFFVNALRQSLSGRSTGGRSGNRDSRGDGADFFVEHTMNGERAEKKRGLADKGGRVRKYSPDSVKGEPRCGGHACVTALDTAVICSGR